MLPANLQALKDQAARVRDETRSVAENAAEQSWRLLLATAQRSLGPLWEFVVNDVRPPQFPHEGPPWGGLVYEFRVQLPGHRPIFALFSGRLDQPKTRIVAGWWRAYYPGMRPVDVAEGTAYWLADRGEGRTMGHYQTLGAALLAAEIGG